MSIKLYQVTSFVRFLRLFVWRLDSAERFLRQLKQKRSLTFINFTKFLVFVFLVVRVLMFFARKKQKQKRKKERKKRKEKQKETVWKKDCFDRKKGDEQEEDADIKKYISCGRLWLKALTEQGADRGGNETSGRTDKQKTKMRSQIIPLCFQALHALSCLELSESWLQCELSSKFWAKRH